MEIKFIRSSNFGSWEYCQHSFFLQNNLGFTSKARANTVVGSATHKCLECLALAKQQVQQGKKTIKFKIGQLDYEYPAADLMCDYLVNEIIQNSCGFYKTFDTSDPFLKKHEDDVSKLVWQVLEERRGIFDPRQRNIIEPEYQFEYDWPQIPGLKIKGTIDLITQVGNSIEVVDYKTGQGRRNWATGKTKEYEDFENDIQLQLYYYSVRKLFPKFDSVIMTLLWVRSGGPFSICFDDSVFSTVETKIKQLYDEISSCEIPELLDHNQNDFRCRKLCSFYNSDPSKNLCKIVHNELRNTSMKETVELYRIDGFDIGKYSSPGE